MEDTNTGHFLVILLGLGNLIWEAAKLEEKTGQGSSPTITSTKCTLKFMSPDPLAHVHISFSRKLLMCCHYHSGMLSPVLVQEKKLRMKH
jgi:hypothetical protein